jgi:hypothetical protein
VKGFIEITQGKMKSIISTSRISGVFDAKGLASHVVPSGCNAMITTPLGSHIYVDETYEQLRDALEAAT